MKDPQQKMSCENCGTLILKFYCGQCGQDSRVTLVPLSYLFMDFMEKGIGVDSRFGHTIKALFFSPGQVAIDFAQGKRQRFISPVKLYFAVCFAFIMAFRWVPGINVEVSYFGLIIETHSQHLSTITNTISWQPFVDLISELNSLTPEKRSQILRDGMLSHANQALIGIVPIFAWFLSFFFRRRFFQEHLIVSLYFNCFALSVLSFGIIPLPATIHDIVNNCLNLILAVYGFLTLLRFYKKSIFRTGLTLLALVLLYIPMILASFYWGLRLQLGF